MGANLISNRGLGELTELLAVAREGAAAGANLLRKAGLPRPGGEAAVKGVGDYVTAADAESEAAIVAELGRRTPAIPILAEEAGGRSEPTMWAVDPLDGTTNFMRGLPVVGVSVGLIDQGVPVLGVVIAPFLGLEFTAARGAGVSLNGESLPRRSEPNPDHAIVATGFPFRDKRRLSRYGRVLEGALERFEDLRRAGAASLDLAWTAAGSCDGFFELGLGPWDVAAGAALVLEAGGLVTDWNGEQKWLQTGNILAGSPSVHAALLGLAARSES